LSVYHARQKWEAGTAQPNLDNLMTLAQFFSVSLDELVGIAPSTAEPTSRANSGYYSSQPSHSKAAAYYIPCRWHYKYKSKKTLLGLPLVISALLKDCLSA